MNDAAAVEAPQNEEPVILDGKTGGRKINRIDMKRAQAYQERRKRLINKGVAPDKVDQVIAEEDYNALPTEQKLKRVVAYFTQHIQGLARDINNLTFNNNSLVGAMEVNNRAFEKGLAKLGLTEEDKKKFLDEAETEIRAEFKARADKMKKDEEEKTKKAEQAQEDAMVASLKRAETPSDAETAVPQEIPDGATTFGD